MPLHVQRGFALIGFGLLVGFVGLIWVANLFGTVDEHVRRMASSRLNRLFMGSLDAETIRRDGAFGRFAAGFGFMAVGLLFVGLGVNYLVAPPAE